MTVIAPTLLALALLAFCVWRERENSAERKAEREAFAAERATLLNRIQAPEIAVLPEGQPVPYAAPDDDKGYWEAVEERSVNGHA